MDVQCRDSGNGASSSDPEIEDSTNGATLEEENSDDDEIEPLRDALERAKFKAGKSSFKREALEAEVTPLCLSLVYCF